MPVIPILRPVSSISPKALTEVESFSQHTKKNLRYFLSYYKAKKPLGLYLYYSHSLRANDLIENLLGPILQNAGIFFALFLSSHTNNGGLGALLRVWKFHSDMLPMRSN